MKFLPIRRFYNARLLSNTNSTCLQRRSAMLRNKSSVRAMCLFLAHSCRVCPNNRAGTWRVEQWTVSPLPRKTSRGVFSRNFNPLPQIALPVVSLPPSKVAWKSSSGAERQQLEARNPHLTRAASIICVYLFVIVCRRVVSWFYASVSAKHAASFFRVKSCKFTTYFCAVSVQASKTGRDRACCSLFSRHCTLQLYLALLWRQACVIFSVLRV